MERYCENPFCENQAVTTVPVLGDQSSNPQKALCAACKEAYDWGVQHGRMTSRLKRVWVLAVADRGIVVLGRAFRTKRKAVQGLAEYLKANEGYRGPVDRPSIADWLAEHDERLGADIFPALLDAG